MDCGVLQQQPLRLPAPLGVVIVVVVLAMVLTATGFPPALAAAVLGSAVVVAGYVAGPRSVPAAQ